MASKVVHFEPTPEKVRKAIEKDLRDDVADAADKLAKDMIMSDAKRLDCRLLNRCCQQK